MLTMATALVVATTIKPVQLPIPNPPQSTITQQDENYENLEPLQYISLTVQTDEKTKQIFRNQGVDLNNRFPIKFSGNQDQIIVHNIKRENFIFLSGEIQQVNTISGNHGQIICQRKKITVSNEATQVVNDQEIFYSINEDINQKLEPNYKYEFFLKITGRIGIFLYRKNENIIQPSNVVPDSWQNRFVNIAAIKLQIILHVNYLCFLIMY